MSLRSLLYLVARVLGDIEAVRKGRIGRRLGHRAAGKVTGGWLRRLFK